MIAAKFTNVDNLQKLLFTREQELPKTK